MRTVHPARSNSKRCSTWIEPFHWIMNLKYYLACDLGAESGRVMLGRLEDGRLTLEETNRFPSAAVRVLGSLRWDVLRIFEELKTGLRKVTERHVSVASLSVDSWGVDYVLINAVHPMLSPPFHYRDARTESTYERVRKQVGSELIFAETGIQFMPINTIYHLVSDIEESSALLDVADCFLTIGDYFNYLFSGVPRVDESNASTTQLYNPRTRSWSQVLIERCGFPQSGRTIRRLHIVGGGSQSALLNQFAASATGRQVDAGPAEATAVGNLLLQAIALGHLGSLAALREVVRDSFVLQTFEPIAPEAWRAAYQRFIGL
jgi:sugar (pentulose or hexulose) kinase